MLGARFVELHGDADQVLAVKNTIAKIGAVLPENLRQEFYGVSLYAPPRTKRVASDNVDSRVLRQALRAGMIVDICYRDEVGTVTNRAIWPIALGYFETTRVMAAWCEIRQDFRSFRTDRILELQVTARKIPRAQPVLLKEWFAADAARKRRY